MEKIKLLRKIMRNLESGNISSNPKAAFAEKLAERMLSQEVA
jgi:hypothetical protein